MDTEHNILYATSCETKREATDEIPQGGVYMIELNNNYAVHQTWAIPFKSGNTINSLESKEDTEAIMIAPDGSLYVAFEQLQDVVSISGNVINNNCDYSNKLHVSFTGKDSGTDDGLEGVALYANTYYFVINENNPLEMCVYHVSGGSCVNNITIDIPSTCKITDIAIFNNEVWFLETTNGQILRYDIVINGGGLITLSYIGYIQLPELIKKNKPDALVLDIVNDNIYIGASGQGSNNPISKIYKLRIANFSQVGLILDEFEHTLNQPKTATNLQAEASTLPNRYQSYRGLYATLPDISHNGCYCQPVISDSSTTPAKTLVMPSSRIVTGALTFFYPEDLGYVNNTLTDASNKKFIGVKVVGNESNPYILTSGDTVENIVNVPYTTRFRVSYVTLGLNAESGDTLAITSNGTPITSDFVYDSGCTINVSAIAGEGRKASLFVNSVKADNASGYSMTLNNATTFKVVYDDVESTTYNVNYTVSGNVLSDAFVVMSDEIGVLQPNSIANITIGDGLTLYVQPYGERTATVKVNDAEVTAEPWYNLTVSANTSISIEFNGDDVPMPFSALTNDEYEIVSATSIYNNIQISDFSGLSMHRPSNSVLRAVSNTRNLVDDGNGGKTSEGGIYQIMLDTLDEDEEGSIVQYWTIPAKVATSSKSYEDTEAITSDDCDNIYLGFERLQQLVKVKEDDDYDVLNTFDFTGRGHDYRADKTQIDPTTHLNYTYDANDGIEGIEFLSGNTFFVSNQKSPSEVILYNAKSSQILNSQVMADPVVGTEVWKYSNDAEAEWEIADLQYVKTLNELWIMNSDRAVIYRYSIDANTTSGTPFLTYINDIKLPMGEEVTISESSGKTIYTISKEDTNGIARNNPEAMTVDEVNGIIYVGAEGSNDGIKPGKLYKFNFSTLKKKVITDFDVFTQESNALKTIAQNYITTNEVTGIPADKLVAMYGRSQVYYDSNWDTACGSLTSDTYLGFKALADAQYASFPSRRTLTLPNGDNLDVPHFWAVIDGIYSGHGDGCGWAGDLVQFAKDLSTEQYANVNFPAARFGVDDWISDADAYNLHKLYPSCIIENMYNYWRLITETNRVRTFKTSDSILTRYNNSQDKSKAFLLGVPMLTGIEIKEFGLLTNASPYISVAANKMQAYLNSF